jgi:hypothetical protein
MFDGLGLKATTSLLRFHLGGGVDSRSRAA